MSSQPFRAARRVVLAVALGVLALLAPLGVAGPAVAAPTTKPTSISVTVRTDPGIAAQLSGVPAASLPAVLAAVGTPFEVEVSLWNGTAPATYPTPTGVTLSAPGPGRLAVVEATIPAGSSTATIRTSYSGATAALQVSVQTVNKKSVLTAVAASFPVDLALNLLDGQSAALTQGVAGADGSGCATVDASHPMCGVLALPSGANGTVALSLGVCPAGQSCRPGALVTQFLADMTGLYTRTAPARMTIVCDKTVCGQGGASQFRALWSQSATGALATTPACPAKGVIGADQEFCTDTVASTRDNAGDLHLVVLFLNDVRGTIK
ncbi:hypothetical protein R8Z57_08955 [Microbacterium sp. M3]|uniref:Uncharacterized protein n=1 Tax=Microbacterium arthrosphaerae TaxID=792652 RepID=A0ABU4H0P1_9MICO|nr:MULTISPECIES: hypothetical protein [Microbacterium]MDW4572897.1 hypothetical protein [Microbacterium arthrosphaerae]MDW7606752.1 hypothetical protein [Microbacterium sp. M3]